MPIYAYKNHTTGEHIEVMRRITETDVLPNESDYGFGDLDLSEPPVWERLISSTTWVQASGYRAGGKGAKLGYKPVTKRKVDESI